MGREQCAHRGMPCRVSLVRFIASDTWEISRILLLSDTPSKPAQLARAGTDMHVCMCGVQRLEPLLTAAV